MLKLRLLIILMISVFYCLVFLTCQSTVTDPGDEDNRGQLPRELTSAEKELIEADHQFSYNLFKQTVNYDQEAENIFISPLSISMTLAMALNGAEGQTFEDIRRTLALDNMDLDLINNSFKSLTELLVTLDQDVQLNIANSIWYREDISVNGEFQKRLRDYFSAEIEGLDFSDPASIDIINNWVKNNTEDLIEKIVDEIPGNDVMYLINALYFKGEWLYRFDPDKTSTADFYLENGETTPVNMMSQEGRLATFYSDEVQMIELPYGDSLFTMTVLMPADSQTSIDHFVNDALTAENLREWRSKLSVGNQETMVRMPRFQLEYELTYNEILKAMGMEIAFTAGQADFSGLVESSSADLWIDKVKHKTFVRVDEAGTEAAAVTSVSIIESLPSAIVLNRPFVFIIYERESGTNLFMGKVKNPPFLDD